MPWDRICHNYIQILMILWKHIVCNMMETHGLWGKNLKNIHIHMYICNQTVLWSVIHGSRPRPDQVNIFICIKTGVCYGL